MSIESENHWRDVETLAEKLYVQSDTQREPKAVFRLAQKFIEYRDLERQKRAETAENKNQKLKRSVLKK